MDGNTANQQGALTALPDPKATCDPTTEEIVDIEFELWTLKMTLSLWQQSWLKEPARRRSATSLREYLLPPDRLSALGPANRLK